jgi:hypothetical protein
MVLNCLGISPIFLVRKILTGPRADRVKKKHFCTTAIEELLANLINIFQESGCFPKP